MKKTTKIVIIVVSILISILIICNFLISSVMGIGLISLILKTTSFTVDVSDYQAFDYNIVWTECDKEIKTEYLPTVRVFYRISNVPTDEYIAGKYRDGVFGADEHPIVMKRKDTEPSVKFDVSSAELFGGGSDVNFSTDDWLLYGQKVKRSDVTRLDQDLAGRLADALCADSPQYVDIKEYDNWYQRSYLQNSEGDSLMLRFSIEQYDELLWMARIVKYEDSYFIEVKDTINSYQYLPCGDDLASVIEKSLDGNNI